MNAKGLALLKQYEETIDFSAQRELCASLPMIVRKAIDAGLPKTAALIQQAVEVIGYECGEMRERNHER